MRPLIGIPCHSDQRKESGRPIYCNNRAYVHAVEDAGGIPILIPFLQEIDAVETLLVRLDGLLFTGGVDIAPALYHEAPHPLLDKHDHQLDELELTMVRWALREDLPILGVCRGMQLLNIVSGGSLYQDLGDQYPDCLEHSQTELPRTHLTHRVYVEAGSRMEKMLGTREFWVNSLHHQAVKTTGSGVRISGRAEDGVAELLEIVEHRFVMAAQCHPEEIYDRVPACAHLFSAFVRACSSTSSKLDEEKQVEEIMEEVHEMNKLSA